MRRILLIIIMCSLSTLTYAVPLAHTTASSLNVRAEPEGSVMGSLPRYTVVGVMETQGNWTKIMFFPATEPSPAKHGWVSTGYLQAIKERPRNTLPNEADADKVSAAN